MVYRSEAPGTVSIAARASGTDRVVESMPLRCSHFDAYRFFTPAAAPRNSGTPLAPPQSDWEQPGCLHANMDLYKVVLQARSAGDVGTHDGLPATGRECT